MSAPEVEISRQQWQAGHRRVERERGDPRLYHRLLGQVDAIGDELRRRLGQTFTLAELDGVYRRSESWSLYVLEEADGEPGWQRHTTAVVDAAFHLYARGAVDYAP